MKPVHNSKNIRAIGFDAPTGILTIQFLDGATYEYAPVPAAVFEQLDNAESKGKFVHGQIVPVYPYRRQGDSQWLSPKVRAVKQPGVRRR